MHGHAIVTVRNWLPEHNRLLLNAMIHDLAAVEVQEMEIKQ